jgi:hypothetical protein
MPRCIEPSPPSCQGDEVANPSESARRGLEKAYGDMKKGWPAKKKAAGKKTAAKKGARKKSARKSS